MTGLVSGVQFIRFLPRSPSLSPPFQLSLCLPLQWSSQTNHAKLTSKFALKGHRISHRTVDLCAAGGRSRPKDNSVFESCMSLLFIWFPRKFNPPCLISYCTICTSDCFLYAYFSLLLYFSLSVVSHFFQVLRTQACGKLACCLILWPT